LRSGKDKDKLIRGDAEKEIGDMLMVDILQDNPRLIHLVSSLINCRLLLMMGP